MSKLQEQFVPRPINMIPLLLRLSISAQRLLLRLEQEWARRAGKENGRLQLRYDQFVSAGISRRLIKRARSDLEACGIIAVTRGKPAPPIKAPLLFRLTYLPTADALPTHDWKKHLRRLQPQ